jgi:hypothetical protein
MHQKSKIKIFLYIKFLQTLYLIQASAWVPDSLSNCLRHGIWNVSRCQEPNYYITREKGHIIRGRTAYLRQNIWFLHTTWQASDSCDSVVSSFAGMTVPQCLAWSPNFNSFCQNSLNYLRCTVCLRYRSDTCSM